jgi:hypothetical protein
MEGEKKNLKKRRLGWKKQPVRLVRRVLGAPVPFLISSCS